MGDFDHSHHQGLAVALINNEAAVIFKGNGEGTFTTSSTLVNAQGEPTLAIGAADFDADGNLDLAIVNGLNGISPVLRGYGSGAFNMTGQLPAGASALAIGDFNGDGKLDLASGAPVWLGNGDGTFVAAQGSGKSVEAQSGIVAGDFNGDGKLDLAETDESGSAVLVLLGKGDGNFQPPLTIAVGHAPDAIVAGDFNNDGKLDLAVANHDDNNVTLLLGNGDGTFTEAYGSPILVGKAPSAIAAADFNGDGKLDLAVVNSLDGTGTVSILLQQ